MRGLRDRVAPLRSESQPWLFDHPRAAGTGDFYGIILAAGIDDQRFRGKADGIETSSELRTGIARDHDKAEFRQGQARLGSDNASGVGGQRLRCDMRRRARPILRATHRQVIRRPAPIDAPAAPLAGIRMRRIR